MPYKINRASIIEFVWNMIFAETYENIKGNLVKLWSIDPSNKKIVNLCTSFSLCKYYATTYVLHIAASSLVPIGPCIARCSYARPSFCAWLTTGNGRWQQMP